jgi:hypothetical protein
MDDEKIELLKSEGPGGKFFRCWKYTVESVYYLRTVVWIFGRRNPRRNSYPTSIYSFNYSYKG